MKLQKDSEEQIAMKSVKDQHLHYDMKNLERERFLQKISHLNK